MPAVSFLAPLVVTGVHASKIPGVWGQSPQGSMPREGSTLFGIGLATYLRLHRLAEAVPFAIHLEDVATVRESIQQSRCHPFTLKPGSAR
jgi:hypothetical protein